MGKIVIAIWNGDEPSVERIYIPRYDERAINKFYAYNTVCTRDRLQFWGCDLLEIDNSTPRSDPVRTCMHGAAARVRTFKLDFRTEVEKKTN